jgi:hypothetical protein
MNGRRPGGRPAAASITGFPNGNYPVVLREGARIRRAQKIPRLAFCGITRVTPSLPQWGRHPKGAGPQNPRFYHSVSGANLRPAPRGEGRQTPSARGSIANQSMISGSFSTDQFFLRISREIICLRVSHGDYKGHCRPRSPTIARQRGPCRPHKEHKDTPRTSILRVGYFHPSGGNLTGPSTYRQGNLLGGCVQHIFRPGPGLVVNPVPGSVMSKL